MPILAKFHRISQSGDFTTEDEFGIDMIKLTAQPIELIVKSGDTMGGALEPCIQRVVRFNLGVFVGCLRRYVGSSTRHCQEVQEPPISLRISARRTGRKRKVTIRVLPDLAVNSDGCLGLACASLKVEFQSLHGI
jgi:hypothetical protein